MVRRNQANDKTAALALAFFLAAIEGAPSQARPENLSTAPGDYVGLGGVMARDVYDRRFCSLGIAADAIPPA
jgi:hypothetical protein